MARPFLWLSQKRHKPKMPERKALYPNSQKTPAVDPGGLPAFATDTDAWNAFREGSESAFIHIYERYFDALFSYGSRILPDTPTVKDVLQDLFIEIRERRTYLGPTDSIKFYLFKCLKRKLHKDLAEWEQKREGLDSLPPAFVFTISHETQLIDQQIDAEKREKLNAAIERLSQRKREIIYYSFYEGMSYRQIQEIMGLENLKTTRNLMYKALQFLRESV